MFFPLCSENDIPSVEDVDAAGGLAQALVKDGMLYLSYAGCFVTVGLQWYVHHSLLHVSGPYRGASLQY